MIDRAAVHHSGVGSGKRQARKLVTTEYCAGRVLSEKISVRAFEENGRFEEYFVRRALGSGQEAVLVVGDDAAGVEHDLMRNSPLARITRAQVQVFESQKGCIIVVARVANYREHGRRNEEK